MTTRNFDALFQPTSIALIGASNEPGSVGAVVARNLFSGGFRGPIMPVNPHEAAIRSAVNYRSIAELPLTPDLAVVATPPHTVPGVIAELGARGCRAAVVITAGFGEGGAEAGAELRQRMLDAARPHLMRIVGPNCLGLISPVNGLNASFAQMMPSKGDIAFVSQSGAVATTVLDWAAGSGLGFSHIVSLGDMSDVDFGDVLDHLALDQATRSILLYVENVTAARKFMSAARIAARAKPVIVVKAGRSQAGAKAALSHTGALAGSDVVYDAAFRRAGMLRVGELRELFDAAATLATGLTLGGDRLAIVTNGGGLGVMAADALEQGGGRLAPLSDAARARLDALLPKPWSRGNPIDILGDADGDRYLNAMDALSEGGDFDAVLLMNCPTGIGDSTAVAEAILHALPEHRGPPILTAWVGQATAGEARRRLRARGLPAYETPEEAIRAFLHLVSHRRNQELLRQTPPAAVALPAEAAATGRSIIGAVLADGRSVLTEPEAKALLAAFGIPVVKTLTAATPAEAADCANRLTGPMAVKILSRDITHKSDVGGVRLDLADAGAVEQAASEMLTSVARKAPTARIDGFTVQEMVHRPGAFELIAGVAADPTFGPVLMVGQGGVAVEVLNDRAMGLPPLNAMLAREMIGRTRIARLLAGYRDVPPADLEAVAKVLVRLSDLVIQAPELVELDINPLLVDEHGAIALDARVVVRAIEGDAQGRLAIRPYPAELAATHRLADGASIEIRPVRPEDEPALAAMIGRCSIEDLRTRFLGVSAPHRDLAARLSQIDYDREMTLVAMLSGPEVGCAGIVRTVSDPSFETANLAILVRSDLQRRGIGTALMTACLKYLRGRGALTVTGDIPAGAEAMMKLSRTMGGKVEAGRSVEGSQVRFDLAPPS